uniref:Fibulin-5 n=1 Tax=Bursaphelenchus xylophilus TaxID=6326 RepID=A0A1I7S3U7_BURXY
MTDIDECFEFGDEMCLEPNTQCLNSAGSFQCVCKMGFYWSHAGQVCVDIDECLIGADCLESQRCLNTPGSYKCIRTLTCGTGYALDSETDQCVDVDECNLGSHDCGALYHCRNTQGSYRCDAKTCGPSEIMNPKTGECTSVNCPSGYEVKNGSCADIDECKTLRRCGFYEECINLPGSYRCQEKGNLCASGFRMDKESGFCLDVDECSTGEHSCNDLQCINLPGSFKCRCSAGFEFNETTKLCEDVDECLKFKGHICSQHATCENTIGSFICHCNKGYQLAPDGRHCDDIDECETGQARCQQRCVNTPGSYQCVCNRGYQLGLDERTCEDIDECSTWARSGQELCMGSCINTPGSFKCTCPLGYALLDDNITCKDIDECASTGCPDPNSVCVNTLGGYRCQKIECPDKYVPDKHYKNRCVRDGSQCVDALSDECKNSPVHISWQHISIPKQVNISSQRTSITLFSMKGPSSSKANMQFELRIVDVVPESSSVNPAVRENFLLQKGDDRNSAIIALRDSLDGPQEVILELTLRLTTNGHFTGKYVANLVVYVSPYKHTQTHRHLTKHHHHHHLHKSFHF